MGEIDTKHEYMKIFTRKETTVGTNVVILSCSVILLVTFSSLSMVHSISKREEGNRYTSFLLLNITQTFSNYYAYEGMSQQTKGTLLPS